MTEIEQLIETGYRLSNTLSIMADNELKFGWDLGLRLEQMSYEAYKIAEELREIRLSLVGGVA